MAKKKGGLGKGLDAIFLENARGDKASVMLKISEIEPNRAQPRTDFDEKALAELADSIAQHGVLQPLLVRPVSGGEFYQIVAGERRWRASRMAGLTEVPVVIRELSDGEVMQLALIENLQREDLSPIEEALGYKSLIENYDFTQDEVAKTVGKSRSAVTNAIRLLGLPQFVLDLLSEGALTSGHARALLSLKNAADIEKVANKAVEDFLSVREVEKICKDLLEATAAGVKKNPRPLKKRNPFFDEVEISLKEILGRRVKVKEKPRKNKGVLEIEFYNNDDLASIARTLEEINL